MAVERKESRRIDLQLQGRSGRQGEPGYSVFYLSLDDDLFLRFGNNYLKRVFSSMRNDVLKSRLLSRTIRKCQKKLQITNYEQRKNLLEHDNVISQQMRVVYRQRDFLIQTDKFAWYLEQNFKNYLTLQWNTFFVNRIEIRHPQLIAFLTYLRKQITLPNDFDTNFDSHGTFTKQEVTSYFVEKAMQFCTKVNAQISSAKIEYFPAWIYELDNQKDLQKQLLFLQLKSTFLQLIDHHWTTHLDELFRFKASSFLSSYGQKSPLQAFIENAAFSFVKLKNNVVTQATVQIFELLNENWKRFNLAKG